MAEGDVPEPTSGKSPNPEDMAKSLKIAGEMEKVGWNPLEIIPQRFTPKGAGDTSGVLEDQLKKTAATPPAEALKSSQWRRDLLKSNESTPKSQGGTSSSGNTSSV